MNKRHYEHTLPNIRGSLSNTYVLKAFITESVTEYWQENRQILFAESFSELKKYIIGTYDEECGILLKDDAELRTYFQTQMITTINRLLKEENPETEG